MPDSIVIPTYGRDQVLCDTIQSLLALADRADEILVVDQTLDHDSPTTERLGSWDREGAIRWIRLERPSITGSMNRGVQEAKGEIVLFLDDDIVPQADLVRAHREAYEKHPEAWAVVGQVLQPEDWGQGEEPQDPRMGRSMGYAGGAARGRSLGSLWGCLDFAFNGMEAAWVGNVMAGNLSVRRERFLAVGGFDETFGPPVAYRFETEFAKRLLRAGGSIRFEPTASIRHLRSARGGTRSAGGHLTSASPVHGVGDYYYALRCGQGFERLRYLLRRPFREVGTRFHLRHPWWIPVKFVGELRALLLALRLHRQDPRLLSVDRPR